MGEGKVREAAGLEKAEVEIGEGWSGVLVKGAVEECGLKWRAEG